MALLDPASTNSPSRERTLLIGVLGLAIACRIAHISAALVSPLSYQPGPDEDYYLQLGQAVAAGRGYAAPELTFMDPGFGYVLGAIFKVFGPNLFVVYAFQALLDTATVYGIFVIGGALGRPRAGLYGALLYALSSTAIMFCATLLKETWVASFLTWWVAGALIVQKTERRLAWLAFGFYCGLGVALRSTLVGMGMLALALPFWPGAAFLRSPRARAMVAAVSAAGLALSLLPWALRNAAADGSLSPLPHNGGIVLHQIYNGQNSSGAIWIPDFVNYLHPSEIWRGYAAEASRRTGRTLSQPEVDAYWRDAAFGYMEQHPGTVLRDIARKGLEFLSATEIPNNRSSVEERMFSPLLRVLPSPTPWLLGMGLAGLLWLALKDRRWPILAAPIFLAWATFAVFWAEDRFRFHAMGVLAFCSGYWVDGIVTALREPRQWRPFALATLAAGVAAISVYLGALAPPPVVRWDHIVWGYIKMGKIGEAQSIAERVVHDQPDNAAMLEALGLIAASARQYSEAQQYLSRAIALRPRSHVAHYNLARVFLALGDREQADREAQAALTLDPLPDYRALLEQIEHGDADVSIAAHQ